MLQCPIVDVPAQTFSASLAGQPARITLRTYTTGLYADVYVGADLIVAGVACRDRSLIVRNSYFGFAGDLMFIDTQGVSDPSSPGLGTRFQLVYIEQSDLAAAGIVE